MGATSGNRPTGPFTNTAATIDSAATSVQAAQSRRLGKARNTQYTDAAVNMLRVFSSRLLQMVHCQQGSVIHTTSGNQAIAGSSRSPRVSHRQIATMIPPVTNPVNTE